MSITLGIFIVLFLLYTIGISGFFIYVYEKDIRPFEVPPRPKNMKKVSINEETKFST